MLQKKKKKKRRRGANDYEVRHWKYGVAGKNLSMVKNSFGPTGTSLANVFYHYYAFEQLLESWLPEYYPIITDYFQILYIERASKLITFLAIHPETKHVTIFSSSCHTKKQNSKIRIRNSKRVLFFFLWLKCPFNSFEDKMKR